MIAVVQRVKKASVQIDAQIFSEIGAGVLVLLGVSVDDEADHIPRLAQKIAQLRIFSDQEGKMNLSLQEINGEALVVSQFTLLADAKKGNRPSYIQAARPEKAIPMYEDFCRCLAIEMKREVKTGVFGADMQVSLINDGPVTIFLDTNYLFGKK